MQNNKIMTNLDMRNNQIENAAVHNLSSAPENPVLGQQYYNTTNNKLYIWNGTEWDELNKNIDLSGLATKSEAAGSLSSSNDTLTLKNINGGTLSTVTVNNVANASSAGKVEATVAADSNLDIVKATVGSNDYARVRVGGATNAGYLEISTADDGNEPIYVRQYTGNFTTVKRTLTLLDGSGNTSFPGTVTATSFSGNINGDNYVQWGGPSLAGSISPTDAGCIDDHGHNKAAYFGGKITVEYMTDGSTWSEPQTLSDANKFLLTTKGGYWIRIGNVSSSGVITADNITNYKARITISSRNASGSGAFYTSMRKLLVDVSTNGATGCKVLLEHRTIANYNNDSDIWTTRGIYDVSGWSGWNSIPCNIAFGGGTNQTGQVADLRLTLYATGYSSGAANLQLGNIRILGVSNWSVNSFAITGHIYDFDVNKNVTFPAKVTASGGFSGNVTGNLSGTASRATADADGNTISTTYLKSANLPTKLSQFTDDLGSSPTHTHSQYLTAHQSIKALKTDNTTAQTASASEAVSGSGTINLHKVSKTGSYADLLNKPTIPTVNNNTITIQKNGTTVDSFTLNQSTDKTINITVPTDISANKINGIPLSTSDGHFFGTSGTAAATVEKVVSIPSITSLTAGQVIIIKPTVTSTVANSTIKLNSFDAYPMRYNNAAITTSTDSIVWSASYPSIWVFDGTYWVFAGHGVDSNTTYSAMSVAEGTTGTATSSRVLRADYLKQIITGTTLTGLDTSSSTAIEATDTVLSGLGKLQGQINTKANSATTLAGYGITNAYTKTEIDGMVAAGMHYKGTVASVSNLPTSGNKVGDLYNVTNTGANYAWSGTDWDKLSENIDLSGLATKAEAAGALSVSNATLTLKNVNGGTLSTVTVNNVANATNATKATQDASGNIITSTYSTKAETVTAVTISGNSISVTKNGSTTTTAIAGLTYEEVTI